MVHFPAIPEHSGLPSRAAGAGGFRRNLNPQAGIFQKNKIQTGRLNNEAHAEGSREFSAF